MNRSKEREQAFLILFMKNYNPELSIDELYEMAVESEFMKNSDFTKKLAELTVEKIGDIDTKISEFSVGWTIDRITKVSLSILRIAVCEMLFMDDIPVGVSINEAVELSKNYAGTEDSQFINGVLGSISKSL
ncbi:MAG: transcription antitermination factor NusB [Oscillospiraceae bacterium]|nr:transcription antitermination factor NusB [Candidatus Limimonas coprohippi]MCQ2488012.1 transcription antitermination factor NusB [Clostridia bacterium]